MLQANSFLFCNFYLEVVVVEEVVEDLSAHSLETRVQRESDFHHPPVIGSG